MGFRFSPGCCCGCPAGNALCDACVNNQVPNTYKVELAGIVANGCAHCDNLNGTYFMCRTTGAPGLCRWEIYLDRTICIFTVMRLAVETTFPSRIQVGLHDEVGNHSAEHADWRKSYPLGPNPDCLAQNLDIPFAPLFTTSGASAQCDFSASTCKMTAVL